MQTKSLIALALVFIAVGAPLVADAAWWNWSWTKKTKPAVVATTTKPIATTVTVTTPKPTATVTAPVTTATFSLAPGESMVKTWLTAYTYYDNDPPGSAAISDPIIHKLAGGTGTYLDPITLAVGFTNAGPDITPGTKYYVPHLRRYVIVEDTCAACHKGYQGNLWLDIWIDGSKTTETKADECARAVTRVTTLIKNPRATFPVDVGPVSSTSCAKTYADTP
ncbi:MAG: hypothetical protein RLZZ283_495 [Candidatus Parcubacteria bacterium]|jgi:hypothetical protein